MTVAVPEGADATVRLSVLVACASVLQVAESLLPHPVPGVRLGLANIITLIVLVRLGPASALHLAILRTVVSSMVLGTFLTPTFVLSLAGGVASALVMAFCYWYSTRLPGVGLSFIGISVAGSAGHILAQVAFVYLLFIRSPGVIWLMPWLALASLAAGLLTGLVASQAMRRLDTYGRVAPRPRPVAVEQPASRWVNSPTSLHRLDPAVKISLVVVLGVLVVTISSPALYAGTFLGLLALAAVAGIPMVRLGRGFRRLVPLLAVSLAMPVLFSPWGRMLLELGPVRVTDEGLRAGMVFSVRILLLFLATALLATTTPPQDIAAGLDRLLSPLRPLGLRTGRFARSLSLSWFYFPIFWQTARDLIARPRNRTGRVDRLIHLPGDVVADLYLAAEEAALRAAGG